MRLINEDDVLEIIERVTNEAVEKKQPKYLIQPRIIAEIAGLPTVDAEPVNGWISVDDRLPELYKNVLTIDSEGKIFINWLEDIIEMKGYFAYGGGTVTHWQHLPKPPKEE